MPSAVFEIFGLQNPCEHTQTHTASDFIFYYSVPCNIALDRQKFIIPTFLSRTVFSARQHMLSTLYAIARPSVCQSVIRVDQSKTVEVRIMPFSPYSSPTPLVFLWDKFHPEISTGSPRAAASNKGVLGKQVICVVLTLSLGGCIS